MEVVRQRLAAGEGHTVKVVVLAVGCVVMVVVCATLSVCYVRHRRVEHYLRTYASRHYNIHNETVSDSAFALSKCLSACELYCVC